MASIRARHEASLAIVLTAGRGSRAGQGPGVYLLIFGILFLGCLLLSPALAAEQGVQTDVLPLGEKMKRETLDPKKYPSKDAWAAGQKLAAGVIQRFRESGGYPEKISAVVWGKEAAGRESPMVSFVLAMLGVEPRWDAGERVVGVELVDLDQLGRPRIDVVVVTTGLFRDLFGQQVALMDRAFRLALASSYQSIAAAQPELVPALEAALEPLDSAGLRVRGSDPLDQNFVAQNWVRAARQLLSQGKEAGEAGELAATRIFAPPVSAYGAGVNFIATKDDQNRLAEQFANRVGHGYSEKTWGIAVPELFKTLLKGCRHLFHCRSDSAEGVLDQDDLPLEYTYLPGLATALAVWGGGQAEVLVGQRDEVRVLDGLADSRAGEPLVEPETGEEGKEAKLVERGAAQQRRTPAEALPRSSQPAASPAREAAREGPKGREDRASHTEPQAGSGTSVFEVEVYEPPGFGNQGAPPYALTLGLLAAFLLGAGKGYFR